MTIIIIIIINITIKNIKLKLNWTELEQLGAAQKFEKIERQENYLIPLIVCSGFWVFLFKQYV